MQTLNKIKNSKLPLVIADENEYSILTLFENPATNFSDISESRFIRYILNNQSIGLENRVMNKVGTLPGG